MKIETFQFTLDELQGFANDVAARVVDFMRRGGHTNTSPTDYIVVLERKGTLGQLWNWFWQNDKQTSFCVHVFKTDYPIHKKEDTQNAEGIEKKPEISEQGEGTV